MIHDNDLAIINEVLEQVVSVAKPEAVFLYNCKHRMDDSLLSFKLCVICEYENKRRLLSDIIDVDCDIPFDILIYTKEQFRQLRDNADAFANRICQEGRMLYVNE